MFGPLHIGTYDVISADGSSRRERHVDLRLVPTIGLLGGLAMAASSPVVAAGLVVLGSAVAGRIWPISGGPALPLARQRVS